MNTPAEQGIREARKQATHTPGPWRIERSEKENLNIRDAADNVPAVCRVYREVDAPLIAAAPDLLEALKYVLPSIAVSKAYERAVAAIAKAEGQQ